MWWSEWCNTYSRQVQHSWACQGSVPRASGGLKVVQHLRVGRAGGLGMSGQRAAAAHANAKTAGASRDAAHRGGLLPKNSKAEKAAKETVAPMCLPKSSGTDVAAG